MSSHSAYAVLLFLFLSLASCGKPITNENTEVDYNTNLPNQMDLHWKVYLGAFRGTPMVFDDVVVVTFPHHNNQGMNKVIALDSSSLLEVWSIDVDTNSRLHKGTGEALYIVFGDSVIHVNISTGHLESQCSTNYEEIGASARIAFDQDIIYIYGTFSEPCQTEALAYVYAFDEASNSELWRFSTSGRVSSPLVFTDDYILLGTGIGYVEASSGSFHAISIETGQEVITQKMDDPVLAITAKENIAYFISAQWYMESYYGTIHAIDLTSQNELWQRSGYIGDTHPLVTDDYVILGQFTDIPSVDGRVIALNRSDGRREWDFLIKNDERPGPTSWFATDGSVILFSEEDPRPGVPTGDEQGVIHALDLSGNELWQFETGGAVGRPVFSNGTLYFTSQDGYFYALR